MLNLTSEQINFLDRHNIDKSRVIDVFGMKSKDYKNLMEKGDFLVAINAFPCRKSLHTIRSKSNCLECDTASIAFLKRWYDDAYVYCAISCSGQLLKVGLAKDVSKRIYALNTDKYAGFSDWQAIYYAQYPKAGEIESNIHHKLLDYRYKKEFTWYQKQMISYEIFKCNYKIVKDVFSDIKKTLKLENIKDEWEKENAEEIANFPILLSNSKRIGFNF